MPAENILIAYDGSPGSRKALEWGKYWAGKLGSRTIVAAIVNDDWGWSAESDPEVSAKFTENQHSQLSAVLKEAESSFTAAGIAVTTVIGYGSPADELISIAANERADLIITGTRGYGKSPSLMLGSVAHRLVSNSPIPVVVVK